MTSSSDESLPSVDDRPCLVLESGLQPGQVVVLAQDWVSLGRSADNDIVLRDLEVSRRHARLCRSETDWVLEDLGSTNGTFVNGRRLLTPCLLQHGDIVNLCTGLTLTFRRRCPFPIQPAPAAGPTKMPRAPAQGQVPLGGSSTGCAAWDTMAATPIRRPAGIPAAAHGDHEKVTAVRRRGPFRRLNRSARWLAGLVLALIVTGLVCVAWLASLPRPEPGSVPIPFVTVIPAGTPWTPPAAVSTSVP